MKIYSETSLSDFKFWSGAKDNAEELTDKQFDELESHLQQLYPEGMDETAVNDLLWFEFDWIKDLLGIEEETEEEDTEE